MKTRFLYIQDMVVFTIMNNPARGSKEPKLTVVEKSRLFTRYYFLIFMHRYLVENQYDENLDDAMKHPEMKAALLFRDQIEDILEWRFCYENEIKWIEEFFELNGEYATIDEFIDYIETIIFYEVS